MKNIIYTLLSKFVIILFITGNLCAQPIHQIYVGDTVPIFALKLLPKFSNKKLTILDFWATSCGSCIEALPALKILQQKFRNEISIVPVNAWEAKDKVLSRLAKINERRKKDNLLPLLPDSSKAMYADSIFIKLFPTITIPQHVWLDSSGKVLAITTGYNTTAENIERYLKNRAINLVVKNDSIGDIIRKKGLLQPVIDAIPAPYYSAFIPNKIIFPFSGLGYRDTANKVIRRIVANESVEAFYSMAYNGAINPFRIIWETSDKAIHEQPKDKNQWDTWGAKYRLSYIIQYPSDDFKNFDFSKKLQQDIDYFFGLHFGITSNVEKRTYNAFVLKKIKNGLLDTSSTVKEYKYVKDKILQLNAQPFYELTSQLSRLENMQERIPFIDESGINPRQIINITLRGKIDKDNLQDLRQQLRKYGLDIIRAQRTINVLVIKDR